MLRRIKFQFQLKLLTAPLRRSFGRLDQLLSSTFLLVLVNSISDLNRNVSILHSTPYATDIVLHCQNISVDPGCRKTSTVASRSRLACERGSSGFSMSLFSLRTFFRMSS